MQQDEDKYAKVLFRYHSNVLDQITVETLYAEKVDEANGIYKLNSIPFYGPLIATSDEFFAEFDEAEGMLTYRKTTRNTGNSVVLVSICKEGVDKEVIRAEFKQLNCASEGFSDTYFSMEVLVSTNYSAIKEKLDEFVRQGTLDYAEPCLSNKHRMDLK